MPGTRGTSICPPQRIARDAPVARSHRCTLLEGGTDTATLIENVVLRDVRVQMAALHHIGGDARERVLG